MLRNIHQKLKANILFHGETLLASLLNSRTREVWDFTGGPVVKAPHFTVGGTGLIPGQGALRSHMLHGMAKNKQTKRTGEG